MTFEHGFVIGKLIPRLFPPLAKGRGCSVVSWSPWWGPPVLLPLLPTAHCLHGKEANGWGLPQPWFPWQPSGAPTSSHMTGLSPLPPTAAQLFGRREGGWLFSATHNPVSMYTGVSSVGSGCPPTHGTHPELAQPAGGLAA